MKTTNLSNNWDWKYWKHMKYWETAMETTNIGVWKQQSKQLTWPTLVSGRRGGTGERGRWLRPQSQETPIFQLIFANVSAFVFAFVSVVVFVSPE